MEEGSNTKIMKLEMLPRTMKDALEDKELVEVDFGGELISALEELEKSRKRNKALKEQLSKHREQVEEIRKLKLQIMEQLTH